MRFMLLAVLLTACSDWTYGRVLVGKVSGTGTRLTTNVEGVQEKVSLVVSPVTVDSKINEVAGGPSGVVIECSSTRCTSISIGTCHRFMCAYENRYWEPDVISCKHEKEVSCP